MSPVRCRSHRHHYRRGQALRGSLAEFDRRDLGAARGDQRRSEQKQACNGMGHRDKARRQAPDAVEFAGW
jgi:hypothetical protein